MTILQVISVEEIFKRCQECLKNFGPNTHHCTTSPLALCEGLCPMWTTWNTWKSITHRWKFTSLVFNYKIHICFLWALPSLVNTGQWFTFSHLCLGPVWHFVTRCFLWWGQPLAVCNCLFNIFTSTLHTWRPYPPSATWGYAMLWW
jgi:hypothetical protein